MSTRFDICTPRKGRDDKTFWTRIGTAWQSDKGIQLVFDALPIPDSEGRCVANLFEPRDNRSGSRDRQDAQARGGPQPRYEDDSEIPF
jgi:hypothetical protein